MATKEELLKTAEEMNLPIPEGATYNEIKSLVAAAEKDAAENEPVDESEVPATEAPKAKSDGELISEALLQGMREQKEHKAIKIDIDKTVQPRFSVVRNKDGEIFLRENATKQLSKVQLKSLEEKEASIQGQEVEEV